MEIYPHVQSRSIGRVYPFSWDNINLFQINHLLDFIDIVRGKSISYLGELSMPCLGRSMKPWRCLHQDFMSFFKLAAGRGDIRNHLP